ncbi:MAG: energy transducer TonB [Acidobacteriota bacterium]
MRIRWILLLILLAWTQPLFAQAKQFLYLSAERIVTLELVDDHSVVLNYFDLGKTYELLTARQLVLLGPSGEVFRGHLFKEESPKDPFDQFSVSKMARPGEYAGYVVVGRHLGDGPVSRVLMMVSGRILELEPLTAKQFNLAAARIGELDLDNPDRAAAIRLAGFNRGYGTLSLAGTAEAGALEAYFPEANIVPPVPISTPAPRLPSSEKSLPDPVVVQVSVYVSRAGGLRDVKAIEGPSEKLEQIAVQTVQNSWVFLPAISENKVAEAEMKLNVVFTR